MGWVKNHTTSTLAFNITQFFLLLNYYPLSSILDKAGFDSKVLIFFQNYYSLVGKKTKYFWNSFFSPFFNVDIRVGQDLALSPILFTLYLSSIFYIFKKWLKNLKIPISILSFVDDRLLISQNKFITVLNVNFIYSYNVISTLFF